MSKRRARVSKKVEVDTTALVGVASQKRGDAWAQMDHLASQHPWLRSAVDLAAQGWSAANISKALAQADNPHTVRPAEVAKRLAEYDKLEVVLEVTSVQAETLKAARGYSQLLARCYTQIGKFSEPVLKADGTPDRELEVKRGQVLDRLYRTAKEIIEAQSKLLGLNAAERVEVAHTVNGLGPWLTKFRSGQVQTPAGLLDRPSPSDAPQLPPHTTEH